MKIESITRKTCSILRDAINAHLKSLDIEGVACKLGNGSFNDTNVTFKLEVALVNDDGQVQSKEVTDWSIYCYRWNMAPDDMGKQFKRHDGEVVTIIGCKPKSHKYPILARNTAGKVHKYGRHSLTKV